MFIFAVNFEEGKGVLMSVNHVVAALLFCWKIHMLKSDNSISLIVLSGCFSTCAITLTAFHVLQPPKVKAFIDKVIQCPLQDIQIPLSGFRWEYSKVGICCF